MKEGQITLRRVLFTLLMGWVLVPVPLLAVEAQNGAALSAMPSVQLGMKAWKRGDHAAARTHWQQASVDGDVQAMYLYSQLLARGEGGVPDPDNALLWLRASADGGFAPAQFNLGNHYQSGAGITRDLKLAAHWWRQAALQGLAPAQYNLGTLYYQGSGVPRDRRQARLWYEQAAARGSSRAAKMLAAMEKRTADQVPVPKPAVVTATQPATEQGGNTVVGLSPQDEPLEAAGGLPEELQGLALGPEWLARQQQGGYTLQILATRKSSAVKRFLQDHRFNRQVAVFPFRRDAQEWYAVLYGRYADVAEAKAAVASLPSDLQKNTPWVRPLTAFQPPAHP